MFEPAPPENENVPEPLASPASECVVAVPVRRPSSGLLPDAVPEHGPAPVAVALLSDHVPLSRRIDMVSVAAHVLHPNCVNVSVTFVTVAQEGIPVRSKRTFMKRERDVVLLLQNP